MEKTENKKNKCQVANAWRTTEVFCAGSDHHVTDDPSSLQWLSCKKKSVCQCESCGRCSFYPWVGKIPWRRKWQPTPVFFLGKSHGQKNLAGYSPLGCQESDTTEHARTHALSVWIGFREAQSSQQPRVSWVFIHKDLLVFLIPESLSMKSKPLDGVKLILAVLKKADGNANGYKLLWNWSGKSYWKLSCWKSKDFKDST